MNDDHAMSRFADGDGPQNLFAWIAADRSGVEGIIAYPSDSGVLPLVATDLAVAAAFEEQARHAAKLRKSTARLIRFTRMEVLLTAD